MQTVIVAVVRSYGRLIFHKLTNVEAINFFNIYIYKYFASLPCYCCWTPSMCYCDRYWEVVKLSPHGMTHTSFENDSPTESYVSDCLLKSLAALRVLFLNIKLNICFHCFNFWIYTTALKGLPIKIFGIVFLF